MSSGATVELPAVGHASRWPARGWQIGQELLGNRAALRAAGLAGLAASGLFQLNLAVLTGAGGPRAAIGLPTVLLVPGALLLRATGLCRRGWEWALHAVAASLAVLLGLSLLLAVLPAGLGTARTCLAGFDLLVVLCAGGAALAPLRRAGARAGAAYRPVAGRARAWQTLIRRALLWWTAPIAAPPAGPAPGRRFSGWPADNAAALVGGGAVLLAVAGARWINADDPTTPAAAALTAAVAAIILAVLAASAGRTGAAAAGLYLAALAVLLATSLRGEGVTGHDIKIEYRVLLTVLEDHRWHPGGIYPGYNSCLSITVLPAFLARLLGIAAIDVFRICYQLVFALVPVGVLLIGARVATAWLGAAAAGFFVIFPAFVNDMPMLNRQEIALVFFTVLVLLLLDVRGDRATRTALLVATALAMTVSHYSTTYIAACLVAGAWLTRAPLWALRNRLRNRLPAPATPPRSTVTGRAGRRRHRGHLVGLALPALVLIGSPVLWAMATGSAGALGNGLSSTAAAIDQHTGVASDATRYAAGSRGEAASEADVFAFALADLIRNSPRTAMAPVAAGCMELLQPSDILPVTAVGAALASIGLPPEALNTGVRQVAVVLYQGGVAFGVALLLWRSVRSRLIRPGLLAAAELGIVALATLASTIAAPQLSDAYGLLRMFQQLLIPLGPPMAIALSIVMRQVVRIVVRPIRRLPPRPAVGGICLVLAACGLSTTGLVPQLTGGYPPQLNLNNSGVYNRAYYLDDDDLAVAQWVAHHLPADAWIVADSRDTANLRALTRIYPQEGIVLDALPRDANLMIRVVGGHTMMAVTVAGDRALRYSAPVNCVARGRPLLLDTGAHRLYGPVSTR